MYIQNWESVSHLFATYCREVYPINAQGGGLSWTVGPRNAHSDVPTEDK